MLCLKLQSLGFSPHVSDWRSVIGDMQSVRLRRANSIYGAHRPGQPKPGKLAASRWKNQNAATVPRA
ncbi:hypothetical protein MishRS11D_15030 [Methylomagnum ishizawai]|nr:hypothetical protein MishRS11D_15030 [Methylomagnum ishizawai]